jgi:hypothetical protein
MGGADGIGFAGHFPPRVTLQEKQNAARAAFYVF